jgi:hypothetical protein
MDFRMHKSGLHYYDPRKEQHLTFVNTVSENKTGFTKRQIKCAELARNLYKTLSYPSMKDCKWVIRSNQIKDCPMTIQDIDVATKMWGKNIAALKGKTTQSKTHPVTRDNVKVPKELVKLHKEVFLTTDIFFVNKIPFYWHLVARYVLQLSITSRTETFRRYSRLSSKFTSTIYNVVSTSQRCMLKGNSHLSRP